MGSKDIKSYTLKCWSSDCYGKPIIDLRRTRTFDTMKQVLEYIRDIKPDNYQTIENS